MMQPISSSGLPYELDLLSQMINYQKWIARAVSPYLGRRIMEIGAGIGNMSRHLHLGDLLVLGESDVELFRCLKQTVAETFPRGSNVCVEHVDARSDLCESFGGHDLDTIVSFNVLEHIEDDYDAISKMALLLRDSRAPGPKRLVSFVPAHQWAFGEIDRTYGHYRRYDIRSFERMVAQLGVPCSFSARYFNVIGLPGWLLLGRVLRRAHIDPAAVKVFERICPLISGVDDFLHTWFRLHFGQSLITVLTF